MERVEYRDEVYKPVCMLLDEYSIGLPSEKVNLQREADRPGIANLK